MALQFRPLSTPPKGITHCLVRRNLDSYLEVDGKIQYGVKERRSQFIISLYTGVHWIGRESHWELWAEIPSEANKSWSSAKLFIPECNKPVLTVLPQPVFIHGVAIPAGFHFGLYQDNGGNDKTWKIYQRNKGAKTCWVDIGMRKISSWLPLSERLRSDI